MKIYNFNHLPENRNVAAYVPGSHNNKNPDKWGGGHTHRLLAAAYTLAFWCMLRVDEVLKIQMHQIKVSDTVLTLTLPYRKTHQYGGEQHVVFILEPLTFQPSLPTEIQPFHLHLQPVEEAHLCPVRAVADWIKVSGTKHGYLFRRMDGSDRVTEKSMVTHCSSLFIVTSSTHYICRPRRCSWRCSGTIFSMCGLTPTPTAHIPSVVVGASSSLHINDGP